MSKIAAIIVDDEHLARENLRLLLNEFLPRGRNYWCRQKRRCGAPFNFKKRNQKQFS